MAEVRVRDDESFDDALRRFKRACERSGVLKELKKRKYYEKPSVRKKRKAIAARKRQKRREGR